MPGIELYKFELLNEFTYNVAAEFRFIAKDIDMAGIYDLLADSPDLINKHRTCYLYGFGKQQKSVYSNLEALAEGYDVLWYGYDGPGKYKWLSYFTASTSGLVRINETRCLTEVLDTLSKLAMVGVFSLSASYAAEFEKKIIGNRGKHLIPVEDMIKEDDQFFYWIIDGDNFDQEHHGFLCTAAYGKSCPDSLRHIADYTRNRW